MGGHVGRCRSVPATEVESRMDDFLQAVEAGETVVLTRDGQPVATLTPATGASGAEAPGEAKKKGLASLAGGWEGSDELADRIEEIRRAARSA
jgi:antitoxin (DNA-binding transcriptional repressor) of toxin-antitoxin stability system